MTGAASATYPAFYRTATNQFLHEIKVLALKIRPNLTEEEWRQIAQDVDEGATIAGLSEAGTEAASQFLTAGIFGGLGGKIFSSIPGIKNIVQRIASNSVSKAASRLGMAVAEEQVSEGANFGISEKNRQNYGLRPDAPTVKEFIGEHAGAVGVGAILQAGGCGAVSHLQTNKQIKDVTNALASIDLSTLDDAQLEQAGKMLSYLGGERPGNDTLSSLALDVANEKLAREAKATTKQNLATGKKVEGKDIASPQGPQEAHTRTQDQFAGQQSAPAKRVDIQDILRNFQPQAPTVQPNPDGTWNDPAYLEELTRREEINAMGRPDYDALPPGEDRAQGMLPYGGQDFSLVPDGQRRDLPVLSTAIPMGEAQRGLVPPQSVRPEAMPFTQEETASMQSGIEPVVLPGEPRVSEQPASTRSPVGQYARSGSLSGQITNVLPGGKIEIDGKSQITPGIAPNWAVQDEPFTAKTATQPKQKAVVPPTLAPAPVTAEAQEERTAPVQNKKSKFIATTLRKNADSMQARIDERLGERETNTPRKARMAESIRQEGMGLQGLQATMRKLADAHDEGTIPESLANVKTKVAIESLDRAINQARDYTKKDRPFVPMKAKAGVFVRGLRELLDKAAGKPGIRNIKSALPPLEQYGATITTPEHIKAVESLLKITTADTYTKNNVKDAVRNLKRFHSMGITTDEQLQTALKDYIKFKEVKAEDPKAKEIREKEQNLRWQKIPGFFPTPKPIVEKMMDEADIQEGDAVLEPSAGIGDIANGIKARGSNPDVVEINPSMRDILQAKGHNVVSDDFLSYDANKKYDKIVMNPPFEKGQDIDHVRKAYGHLKPGGKLVAIMGAGTFSNSQRKTTAFREWLEEVGGESEQLPANSFKGKDAFKETGVSAYMVTIEKESSPGLQDKHDQARSNMEQVANTVISDEKATASIKQSEKEVPIPREEDFASAREYLAALQQWREETGNANRYEQKREDRANRMEERSDRAKQKSSEHHANADKVADGIPFGQPILVGHHSEARARRDQDKIWKQTDKAVEESKKADHYSQRAASIRNNDAISSDDEDAIIKLKAKIEEAQELQDRMKAVNRAVKKKDVKAGDAELRKMGYSDKTIERYRTPDDMGQIGFPGYALTNNNANINRMKKRLASLEQARNDETREYKFDGGTIVDDVEGNRVRIFFDGKPDAETRENLKKNRFLWARSVGAWQKKRGAGNLEQAKNVTGYNESQKQAKTTDEQSRIENARRETPTPSKTYPSPNPTKPAKPRSDQAKDQKVFTPNKTDHVDWFVAYTDQPGTGRTTETKRFSTLAEAKAFSKGKHGYITRHSDGGNAVSTKNTTAKFVEYFGDFEPTAQEGKQIQHITGEKAPARAKDTEKGIALYARPKGQKTNNVTFAQAKAIVDRLRSVLADDVLIEAVESEQDLPAKIRNIIEKDKAHGTPGFFLDGKIWIISDNVPNSGYIISEVFRHEMTHAGLKKLRAKLADAYGGDVAKANKAVDTILNQVYIAKIKEIRKMATGQYKGGFNLKTGEGRRGLAEEWLAEQGRESKWYDRYVAAIARMFRAVGAHIGIKTKITDAEIRTLLQDARGALLRDADVNMGKDGVPAYLKAYHGTPHRGIEKFSTDKIGTGEGVQAYGYGLYFASKKEVAEWYRKGLSEPIETVSFPYGDEEEYILTNEGWIGSEHGYVLETSESLAATALYKDVDLNQLIMEAKENGEDTIVVNNEEYDIKDAVSAVDLIDNEEIEYKTNLGQLYEVEIPEDNELLDWDKSLSEQPKIVQNAFNKISGREIGFDEWIKSLDKMSITALENMAYDFDNNNTLEDEWDATTTEKEKREDILSMFEYMHDDDPQAFDSFISGGFDGKKQSGEGAYRQLATQLGSERAASNLLRSHGVKGVRYLDGTSRSKGDGSHNYVIFDGDDTEITQTYYARPKANLAPNDDRIMYSRPKNSVKSKIMGAEGIEPEITEHFKTGDLGRLAEIFKLPYWLGKKFPAIGKMVDTYYKGTERKADMASRSLAEVEDLWKLPKEKMKELSGIVQAHDGKPIKSITSKKFIRRMDENNKPVLINGRNALDLNPKYQEDFKAYVDTLKASPDVKKAFVDLRESLDNDLLRAYSKMLEMKDVDGGVIQEMRTNINQVHNYFPHHRYGKYYVRAIDAEGNVVFRTHYDALPGRHKGEGLKIINKMKKEHPGARWEMGINQKLPDEIYDFPIPVEAMEQIIMAAGKSLDKDTQKAFEQIMPEAVANVMKSRGWGSHMIHRNDIPGHETEDIQRVLLDYKTGLSGWIAKMETSRELGNIMRSVKGDKTPNLYRYCQQYMQDVLRNQDDIDKTVGKVKAATFAWYLGGNIKTAMLNLTQNIIVGWPTLAQHTGGSGVKMMDATMKKIIKSRLTDNETKLLDDLIHSGITTDNYLRWIRGQVGGGSITDKALHVLGLPMSFAERFNRSSMALAAFRAMRDGKIVNKKTLEKYGLKKGEKADYAKAREFASDMVRDAHYLYGKGNMPQPLRSSTAGRAASPIFTFRTFTANTVLAWEQMLFHMGKEGRKAFARSMLATISLGGLTAIPLYATIKQVLQTALESDDDPVEEWAEQFDEQTTSMLLYGVPALAGVSLKGSISMETPFTGIVDNKSNKVLTNILGVTYDLLVDKPGRAWNAYKHSDYSRMVEEAMPTFIANGMKAFRLYNEGQTTVTGTTIPDETGEPRKIDKSEALGKIIGFQPVKLSRDYEKYHSGQVTKKLRSDKQGEIASEAVSAVRSGDRKAFRKAMEKLYAWNKKQYAKGNIHLILKPSNVNASIKRRLSGQSDPWYLKIKESGK
jgi:predicted RNA methylase